MLRWSEADWLVFLKLLLIALPVTLFTFEEEYGWRGYLLLERLTPHMDEGFNACLSLFDKGSVSERRVMLHHFSLRGHLYHG
jgi:hypothetical protein